MVVTGSVGWGSGRQALVLPWGKLNKLLIKISTSCRNTKSIASVDLQLQWDPHATCDGPISSSFVMDSLLLILES